MSQASTPYSADSGTSPPEDEAPLRRIYHFGNGEADGDASMVQVLGGKGANLAEMSKMGLPVPCGFTLTTDLCAYYHAHDNTLPPDLRTDIEAAIKKLEAETKAEFGDNKNPLLLSVRSGAPSSMPGMMDTVLNLGLNDETVHALAAHFNDTRFAWDSYRRFLQLYGDVVMGVSHDRFEDILDDYKLEKKLDSDSDFTAQDWQHICAAFRDAIGEDTGQAFPQSPSEQLWAAVSAVFASWHNPRAITYRRLQNIAESPGTAVTIQAMVFGNLSGDSATGVAFTRNPSTGQARVFGEFLPNAQGEDIVSGIRTPLHITKEARLGSSMREPSLEESMPETFSQLCDVFAQLEARFHDMQDIEFTIQQGALFILQTRDGKRTTRAGLKIAADMVGEGILTQDEAVMRLDPISLEQLLHPTLDPNAKYEIIVKGLPASPGAASGKVAFTAAQAEERAGRGEDVILLRSETTPEDIHGMYAAQGILTSRGGMTSHAAVVARGLGRPCICGATSIQIDLEKGTALLGKHRLVEGDIITIDGSTGNVMAGKVATLEAELSGDFAKLMAWADAHRTLEIRANAETPMDAARARRLGAEGIGLVRTEHMFFDPERLFNLRLLLLSQNPTQERKAMDTLEPAQREDFAKLFKEMAGHPITIRLLDPPIHEFLPTPHDDITDLADALDMTERSLRSKIEGLQEVNPMLGHRGSRLGLTMPQIYEMQLRALFAARQDSAPAPDAPPIEIMFPLIMAGQELAQLCEMTQNIAREVKAREGDYIIGSMIEVPRAALVADQLAAHAVFFSFGTNDLTQTTLALSRDDAGRFLGDYTSRAILAADPFRTLDIDGVGSLMKIAVAKARSVRPDIKLGLCGEHGGDPQSIRFCHALGFDYVSCSPYRVPIARLAAAQAALLAAKSS